MSRRTAPDDSGDGERLPWLEPYREPAAKLTAARAKAARPEAPRNPRAALWGTAVLALIALAGGGGYWLGQRDADAPPAVEAPLTAAIASRPAAPPIAPPVENEVAAIAEPEVETVPVAEPVKPKPAATRARPEPPRKAKLRRADTKRPAYDRVTAKQREAARTWPKMPSPGPAGQVIQLGAFSTRGRATAAYRQRVARYPLLAGMPQVVVPIITRPRGEVLYVLRLGTQSREQSKIICRNLRRSGDHCLVIG